MTAVLVAATVALVGLLLAMLVVFLRSVAAMVDHICESLTTKVGPGATAVAGHLAAIGPKARQLNTTLRRITE